jgi:hypothetical protein
MLLFFPYPKATAAAFTTREDINASFHLHKCEQFLGSRIELEAVARGGLFPHTRFLRQEAARSAKSDDSRRDSMTLGVDGFGC